MSEEVTFRHETPEDGETVSIPEDVQFDHITMEVGPDGRPHLMWFETDGESIPPQA